MLHFRLIYEQIEVAKAQMFSGSLLGYRLAIILLDNAAELLMQRSLRIDFAFEDHFKPRSEPAYSDWIKAGLGPKYTAEERAGSEREFEPKLRILEHRLGRISKLDRSVLSVCHQIRNEAFHQGRIRSAVLERVAKLLYLTLADLTVKLPANTLRMPSIPPAAEDVAFLERFSFESAYGLVSAEGHQQITNVLKMGVELDQASMAQCLSGDLIERIDATIDCLATLSETRRDEEIDRRLQYQQFWHEVAIDLLKSGVREPHIEEAFRQWQSDGRARYTLRVVRRWRKQAEALGRCASAVRALDHYWAIERRFGPLEDEVDAAIAAYDDWINAQIHS